MINAGDIVTVDLENNASNTYIVKQVLNDTEYILFHPLFPSCFIIKTNTQLNKTAPNIKDSIERCLDFASASKQYLDFNTVADLDSLCLYFAIKRKITPRQKHILAGICGVIASIKFDNNIKDAMAFVTKNQGILDDFNLMWFNNFKGLFQGKQPITSKKQRSAIFNITGYVLAELNNPIISK